MKILFIIASSNFGGTENHLLNLINGLTNAGVDVGIVCPSGGIFNENLSNVFYVNFRKTGFFNSLKSIQKIINEFKPDIIHSHLSRASYISLAIKILYKIPVTATVHNLLGRYKASNKSNPWLLKNTDSVFKMLTMFGVRLIAVSNIVKDALIADKIEPDKIQVISNGTQFADMPVPDRNNIFRNKFKIENHHILVGMTCNIQKGKGQILAVEAISLMPEEVKDLIRLVMIGNYKDDEYKKSIDDFVAQSNLQDKIIFAGVQTSMRDIYADIDIFLHPSYAETCSMAVIEAMSTAKPMVVSNIPANSAIIDDGINGCLVELNPSDIEAALLKLISNDELRKSLSSNAREKAENFYSLEKMTSNYIAFYKSNIK